MDSDTEHFEELADDEEQFLAFLPRRAGTMQIRAASVHMSSSSQKNDNCRIRRAKPNPTAIAEVPLLIMSRTR